MNRVNDYYKLAFALILAATISVSMHALIVQHAHAPLLGKINSTTDLIFGCIVQLGQVTGVLLIYLYSQTYWVQFRWLTRILLFTILILATDELFRNLLMSILVGQQWAYAIVNLLPNYFGCFILSLMTIIGVSYISKQIKWKFVTYLLLVFVTFLISLGSEKLMVWLLAPLLAHLPQSSGHIYLLPYDWHILIPAYLSYLEPTAAAFVLFYLTRNQWQRFNNVAQGIFLSVLIMLATGIFFGSIMQIVIAEGNFFYRIFYYGQFIWEKLALGLCTVYFFKWFHLYQKRL